VNNMDRADEMIRDMLDASKLKAGEKFLLNIKKVNLKELILHTTDDLTTVHGDRFRLHLENIEGYWDEDVLKRMLENLMSNAVKYGSVLFPVTVSTAQENNFVKISVHNHGNPISENETVAIFEPYKRAVNASAQKGWGIGLMLVKGFAEALGGRANVMSSEKDGTVFSLVLPKDSRSTEKS
jgi:signal transduction histidine kinase